jgi:outer membrane immunogenic protein
MKKFLRGALALVALGMTAPAVAADFPVTYTKPVTMIPAWYDWSGLYIGPNGGWAMSHNCWIETVDILGPVTGGNEGCNKSNGGLVGGQFGMRWQPFSSFVVGLELQGDSAYLTGSNPSLFTPGTVNRTKVDDFALFTGQIGFAIDTFLVYAKGGGAVAGTRYHGFVPAISPFAFEQSGEVVRWGATAGAGVEYAFALNWSVAAEYDHVFLGNRTVDFTSTVVPGLFTREDRIRQDMDIFTLRLNYRLLGPVISKY